MKMKPHHLAALVVTGIVAIFVFVHIVGIVRRSVQYHAVLKSYSEVLKPGAKRNEVENYFVMSKYVSFDRGASEDIVEIAREKAGWVCQEQLVYLAFEFDGVEPNDPKPSDRLVRISINRSVCLDLP